MTAYAKVSAIPAWPAIDRELGENAVLPVDGLSCLPFTATKESECVLLLNKHGGYRLRDAREHLEAAVAKAVAA